MAIKSSSLFGGGERTTQTEALETPLLALWKHVWLALGRPQLLATEPHKDSHSSPPPGQETMTGTIGGDEVLHLGFKVLV